MKIRLFLLGLAVLGAGAVVFAEDPTAKHNVTITVSDINELSLEGGNVELTLSSLGEDDKLSDTSSSTSVKWATNGSNRKLTVHSNRSTLFDVFTVEAVDCVGNGIKVEPGPQDIGTGPVNLVTSISEQAGSCGLTYAVESSLSTPVDETHQVTYTLVSTY